MAKIKCLRCSEVFEDSGTHKNCSDAYYEISEHMWNAHSKHEFEVIEEEEKNEISS